jgi:hypothetical protein
VRSTGSLPEQAVAGQRVGKNICLLLTATVDVRGVELERADPTVRFNDYRWALEKWTRCPAVDRIVFVENSGYDIDELIAIPRLSGMDMNSVEFLSFDGQDFPRERGKGLGEAINVEYALENSELLSDDCLIIRVNGRNYVENISAFFDALDADTDILCDLKQYLTWGDGRVLGGTIRFFENYVCPYGREADDSRGYYFEHSLARAIHRGMADGLVWRPFPEPPRIIGFSGTSNSSHDASRLKRIGRAAQHRVKLRMFRL